MAAAISIPLALLETVKKRKPASTPTVSAKVDACTSEPKRSKPTKRRKLERQDTEGSDPLRSARKTSLREPPLLPPSLVLDTVESKHSRDIAKASQKRRKRTKEHNNEDIGSDAPTAIPQSLEPGSSETVAGVPNKKRKRKKKGTSSEKAGCDDAQTAKKRKRTKTTGKMSEYFGVQKAADIAVTHIECALESHGPQKKRRCKSIKLEKTTVGAPKEQGVEPEKKKKSTKKKHGNKKGKAQKEAEAPASTVSMSIGDKEGGKTIRVLPTPADIAGRHQFSENSDSLSNVPSTAQKPKTSKDESVSKAPPAIADDAPVEPARKKRQRTTKKAFSSSPYFSTPTPPSTPPFSQPTRPPRKPRAPTKSPHFPGDPTAAPTRRRVRAGISTTPWPPYDSPRFGLIQEELADQPFQLLVATVFLNRTRGSVAVPLLRTFLARYPTPAAVAAADVAAVEAHLQPLGLQRTRARRLVAMGAAWLKAPPMVGVTTRKLGYPPKDTMPFPVRRPGQEPLGAPVGGEWEVAHIPGVGPYALDSWRIFCRDALRGVTVAVKSDSGGGEEIGELQEVVEEEEWRRVVPKDKELRAYLRWRWAAEGHIWPEDGDAPDHPSALCLPSPHPEPIQETLELESKE